MAFFVAGKHRWRIIGVIILTGCWLVYLSAYSRTPLPVNSNKGLSGGKVSRVYVTNHGWHTGVVVPMNQVRLQLPELSTRFANATWLEFGWGDKGFYQAPAITARLTLAALLWPTPSVMHVAPISTRPESTFAAESLLPLCLNNDQISALMQFINDSFHRDATTNLISDGPGIYADGQFYLAAGRYTAFNTCNTWTAKALYSAGLPIQPHLKLTADSVSSSIDSYKRFNCD